MSWKNISKTTDIVVGEGVSKNLFGDKVAENFDFLYALRSWIPLVMLNGAIALGVGDKGYVWVPDKLNGGTLSGVAAHCATPSQSGVVELGIKKNGTSLLTVNLTIDQAETSSLTAATPCEIDEALAGLATGDEIEITVLQEGSGVQYLGVQFWFEPAE